MRQFQSDVALINLQVECAGALGALSAILDDCYAHPEVTVQEVAERVAPVADALREALCKLPKVHA